VPVDRIRIVEVAPRDGLQNEPRLVSTADKMELIRRAVDAGLVRVEISSFVNPARVPQMADADELFRGLAESRIAAYSGLVLNARGFDRAVSVGCREINFVVVASETFNHRNQGVAIDETLRQWAEIAGKARAAGVATTVSIGASFGCAFEGEVPLAAVLRIVETLMQHPPDEIAFADTIGCGVPSQVRALLAGARAIAPAMRLRCHFHDTRNTGIANAIAAIEAGVHALDSSIGGFGGCPFAPAATGNIATEDLVYALHRMGVPTGINILKLIDTAQWLAGIIGKPAVSGLARAGNFPPMQDKSDWIAISADTQFNSGNRRQM
jgi:hydroxymethylglutaryl-CoA lyase